MTSRKFLLYNSEDDLVDLNNHEIFVLNPTGLGVSFSNSFSNVSANFLQEKSVLNSASLKLDIIFSRNSTTPYEKYEEFVKFLNKPPFKLIYEISGKKFQRDCVLSELSKGEIVTNVLSESLTLDFTTPFYKEISETYKPTSDTEGDGKIYAGLGNPMNLIADPNFEDRSLVWFYTGEEIGGFVPLSPDNDKPESNIVRLKSSANREAGITNSWGLSVKKGDRLSFKVDIRTDGNPDFTRPVIRLGDVANDRTYSYSDFGILSNSNKFKTATISFVVDHDGDFAITLLNKNVSTMSEMSTYFREPMLIRGDVSDMPVEQYDKSYPNLNLLVKTNQGVVNWDWMLSDGDKIVEEVNVDGIRAVKLIKGTTTANTGWNFIRYDGLLRNLIQPSAQYVLSFDVKPSVDVSFIATLARDDYQKVLTDAVTMNKASANQWTKVSCVLTSKETLPDELSQIVYLSGMPTANGNWLIIKNPKLERGSTATPYMPSSSEVKPTDYPSYVPGFYEGKQVSDSYVYSYVYESEYNGESGVFQIENKSVYIGSAKGSPVEITVHGPCTNPYWEILDGSKVLQSDGYNIDLPDGYKLVVSSVVQKQRVKLIAPDGTTSDVYQQQDLSRSNFVTIPEGHVTLAFHNVGDVSFNYREEYITV